MKDVNEMKTWLIAESLQEAEIGG